uniref:Uncharacterized protein n=1 Tax=Lepeophtheirus salmonis TaxID=72036 RepID=A0A0K2V2N2_LEPSM
MINTLNVNNQFNQTFCVQMNFFVRYILYLYLHKI